MELKEMIKVMQHYDNGGEVEYTHNNLNNVFGDAVKKHDGNLAWDWGTYTYRIVEPKQKVTIEKWLCRNSNKEYFIREAEPKHLLYDNKVKLLESYEVEL